jgi:hypothetical protein
MSKVSKRDGISDVGLAKVCRKLDIPVPPRGYWARIAHGKEVTKPSFSAIRTEYPKVSISLAIAITTNAIRKVPSLKLAGD